VLVCSRVLLPVTLVELYVYIWRQTFQ